MQVFCWGVKSYTSHVHTTANERTRAVETLTPQRPPTGTYLLQQGHTSETYLNSTINWQTSLDSIINWLSIQISELMVDIVIQNITATEEKLLRNLNWVIPANLGIFKENDSNDLVKCI